MKQNHMKKVLFIAYNFPPHGGPGVQRSLKFVKYLREFGWEPIVITATEDAGMTRDDALLKDIPDNTHIYRVSSFKPGKLVAKAKPLHFDFPVRVMNVLLALPDPMLLWARKVAKKINPIIQDHKPHVIYSTSGPYSSHLAAAWIKQNFDIPWLADFRDPWSTNLVIPYPPGYRYINRHIEKYVLRRTDVVTCVSKPWLNELYNTLKHDKEKFHVITNGFDCDDIHVTSKTPRHTPFTFAHLGSFYPNRKPEMFIKAINELILEGKIAKDDIRCIFVGENAKIYVPDDPPFYPKDYISHTEISSFIEQAHALLLILASSQKNKGNYSGKIYEYIASNRPILGIVPTDGVAQKLIQETSTGVTCDGSLTAIKSAVLEIMKLVSENRFKHNTQAIQKYTRKKQTENLTKLLDSARKAYQKSL